MESTTYEVVLFLHIAVALFAFSVAGLLHTAFFRLRAATDTREMRSWAPVLKGAEPLLPISAILLIGLGGYLLSLSDDRFGWGDGWVITAVVSLVLVEVLGAVVLGPRTKKVVHAIAEAQPGPVGPEVRAAVTDPTMWLAGHASTGTVSGIVFLMVTKPAGGWSVVAVAIATLVGAVSALPVTRSGHAAAPALPA